MLIITRNRISLTRGDTASFKVNLKNEEGSNYILTDGDKLIFTLKKSTVSEEILIQKNIENGEFKIYPDDTRKLFYGNYVYDIQLTKENGDVCTVVKPSLFEILSEVNFYE